ncbi:ABC transporter permease [Mycobacterium sp. pUA109]|uniref:ABC transporter permease n=1 Tax=Mycobacterium sp. pUA109 TaxID=3238982 RepID=UPI00351BDE0F
MATATPYQVPGARTASLAVGAATRPVARAGHMVYFFTQILMSIPTMLRHYRREMLRLLADVTWGNGSIVVGGSTLNVAAVLGISAGTLLAVEGYSALQLLGMGPATGLISSFATTRELAPVMIGIAFIAQAGCRFTAQLGAMRINDEVDALESMAIKPIPYLVTTRVVATMIAVVPVALTVLALAYLSTQVMSTIAAGQSSGSYLHYFSLVINPRDVLFATLKAIVFVFISSTIQSYYGFFAAGGPAGVGVAAGRAMRLSVTVVMIANMLLTMAMWGVASGARFGG